MNTLEAPGNERIRGLFVIDGHENDDSHADWRKKKKHTTEPSNCFVYPQIHCGGGD